MSLRVRSFSTFAAKASFGVVFLNVSILIAAAQGTLSTIAGVVTDSQGAAVSGATVTATSHSTGVVTTGTSNAAGSYSLPNLPVGEYSVVVEHDGFSRFVSEHVLLSTGQVFGLNPALRPGAVTQTVTVQDEHAELETRTSEIYMSFSYGGYPRLAWVALIAGVVVPIAFLMF